MVEKRYKHSGEEIVLRHRDEPRDTKHGNHSAWFDDGMTSVNLESAYSNREEFPDWIQQDMSDSLVDASVEELTELLEFLAENNLLVCNCGRLFSKDNAVSTGFAGIKCRVCYSDDSYCPESEDNEHKIKVVSGKNNARKTTKKKCTECGYRTQDPPTG